MYYVEDGVLKNSEREITKKIQFCNNPDFEYSMLYPVVRNFSLLHQTINFLIESSYRVNIERVSRTEKNKGRDYSSSSFTVTAGLEKIENGNGVSRKVTDVLYTLKGSTVNFLRSEGKECIKEVLTLKDVNTDIKDTHLYQDVHLENFTPSRLIFYPIKINGLRDRSFYLNSLDQATYLGFVTRWLEMFGNYMIESEMSYYPNQYEFWLFSLLNKYFNYSIIERLEDLEK